MANILIILPVVSVVIGLAGIGYEFYKGRKRKNKDE